MEEDRPRLRIRRNDDESRLPAYMGAPNLDLEGVNENIDEIRNMNEVIPAGNDGLMGAHRAAAPMEPMPAPPPGVIGEGRTTNLSSGEQNMRNAYQVASLWRLSNQGVIINPTDQLNQVQHLTRRRDLHRNRNTPTENVNAARDGRRYSRCENVMDVVNRHCVIQ